MRRHRRPWNSMSGSVIDHRQNGHLKHICDSSNIERNNWAVESRRAVRPLCLALCLLSKAYTQSMFLLWGCVLECPGLWNSELIHLNPGWKQIFFHGEVRKSNDSSSFRGIIFQIFARALFLVALGIVPSIQGRQRTRIAWHISMNSWNKTCW